MSSEPRAAPLPCHDLKLLFHRTGWGTEANTTVPVDTEQARGRLPSYVVQATSAEDVRQAVAFAAEHRLRLRVKNTGHD